MREIKYRFWDKEDESMISWEEITGVYNNLEPLFTLDVFDDEKKIPMQFILKNNDDNDVYEKDYDEDGNMIDYCERCYGYQFFQIDIPSKDIIFCQNCEGNFMIQDHIDSFEIIGNVYENKNLLK